MFLLVSQLQDILSMGFQNKFYNASMMDPRQQSTPGLDEYCINVSSDTPHWYIRDYLARTSSQYNISNIEVDGKILSVIFMGFYFISSAGLANIHFKMISIIYLKFYTSSLKLQWEYKYNIVYMLSSAFILFLRKMDKQTH